MIDRELVNRRSLLKAAGLGVGMSLIGCAAPEKSCRSDRVREVSLDFDNADFYGGDGTFDVDAGKRAYIQLMRYHGYPIFEELEDKLWVSDYGTGRFLELGLGANMFINDEKDRYMVMDLFLLPDQMLPEHYHLPTSKGPAKMEGWLVRHGISYVYGEGEPAKNMKAVIPECHMNGTVTVEHEEILYPGEYTQLNRKEARHWQFGGPEGAIITESATFHDNDGVKHSDPNLVFP